MIDMDYVFTTEHKEVFETVEEAQPYADQIGGTVVAVFLQDGFGAYYTKEDGIFLGYEIKTPEGDYFDAEDCFCECDGGEESTINNNDKGDDEGENMELTRKFNKIENIYDSPDYLNEIERLLIEDGYDVNDESYAFESHPKHIYCIDDVIKCIESSNIVYVDDAKFYAVTEIIYKSDDTVDVTYSVFSMKKNRSQQLIEYLNEKLSECYSDDAKEGETIVEFTIVKKTDNRLYLKGNFDLASYDADTNLGDWEYEQNDGTYASHLPKYWKINGVSYSVDYDDFIYNIDFEQLRKDLFKYATENRTINCGEYLLHINDGAKMECEIEKPSNFRGDYIVEVIPRFNGEKVDLISYMNEMGEIFDPFGNNEPTSCTEDGHIYFEIPKSYCEGDSEDKQYIINEINEEARRIYAMSLTREMCIYSRFGEVLEQSMDNDYDDAWLFKMTMHKNDCEEELTLFLKEEGLIDELI